ncbi:hypothetical protein ABT120_19725 [Nonomuraea angiospora]|uniref:hypothetical protein n=1 Tax=Nonomuraea angiospora TaxID=46172 RepID=UPI0033216E7C
MSDDREQSAAALQQIGLHATDAGDGQLEYGLVGDQRSAIAIDDLYDRATAPVADPKS